MISFDIILPTVIRPSLFEAINSVVNQAYNNWNLYIIQDNILAPDLLVQAFPITNIQWLPLKRPHKQDFGAAARTTGLYYSTNNWITYIDDDDEWLPHHLSTLARLIEENPGVNMVRTAGQSFMMKHKSPRSSKLVRKMGPVNSTDILTVGMAHTRDIFKQTTGWQPVDNHDHLLWKEMLAAGGKAVVTDEVTFHFRR